MFYNEIIHLGDEKYKWGTIVTSAILYKKGMLYNPKATAGDDPEKIKAQRLYNWIQGAYDWADRHSWNKSDSEMMIYKYYAYWKEGE